MIVFAVYVFGTIHQVHQVSYEMWSLMSITIGLRLGFEGFRECMGRTKIVTIFNRIVRDLIYITATCIFVENVFGSSDWRST
jgi:hypothetical protein